MVGLPYSLMDWLHEHWQRRRDWQLRCSVLPLCFSYSGNLGLAVVLEPGVSAETRHIAMCIGAMPF